MLVPRWIWPDDPAPTRLDKHDPTSLCGELSDCENILRRLFRLTDDEVELQVGKAGCKDELDLLQQHPVRDRFPHLGAQLVAAGLGGRE